MLMIGRAREGDASVGNGTQLSFVATDPATVDAAHACALAQGATCLGPPGPRGALGIGLYACYFRDPDGNKVIGIPPKRATTGRQWSYSSVLTRTVSPTRKNSRNGAQAAISGG